MHNTNSKGPWNSHSLRCQAAWVCTICAMVLQLYYSVSSVTPVRLILQRWLQRIMLLSTATKQTNDATLAITVILTRSSTLKPWMTATYACCVQVDTHR